MKEILKKFFFNNTKKKTKWKMRFYSIRTFRFLVTNFILILIVLKTGILSSLLETNITIQHKNDWKVDWSEVYNPFEIKQIPSETIDDLYMKRKIMDEPINWNKYAYVNYATNVNYLCNGLLAFDALKNKFHTKAKLVMLIGDNIFDSSRNNQQHIQHLIKKLELLDTEQVIIKNVSSIVKQEETSWQESLTKLYLFDLVEYERVIYFDNDSILNGNMDELFFLPEHIKFAAPLAYWFLNETQVKNSCKELEEERMPRNINQLVKILNVKIKNNEEFYNDLPRLPYHLYMEDNDVKKLLNSSLPLSSLLDGGKLTNTIWGSELMVVKPSAETSHIIKRNLLPELVNQKNIYDMDLINLHLYNMREIIGKQYMKFKKSKTKFIPETLVIPYSRYGLLTGSIIDPTIHGLIGNGIMGFQNYDKLGNLSNENFLQVVEEAKYVHYSDYPYRKPWTYLTTYEFECTVRNGNTEDEANKKLCKIWTDLIDRYLKEYPVCRYE